MKGLLQIQSFEPSYLKHLVCDWERRLNTHRLRSSETADVFLGSSSKFFVRHGDLAADTAVFKKQLQPLRSLNLIAKLTIRIIYLYLNIKAIN
jgi:hypothetical protein